MWDETEICYSFKTAADKNKQIQILAELNDVPMQTISEILSRNGLIVGTPMKKKTTRKGVDWSVMDEEDRLEAKGKKAEKVKHVEQVKIDYGALHKAVKLLQDAGFAIEKSVLCFMDGKFVIEGCARDE